MLNVQNISYKIGANRLLKDISFHAKPSQLIAIIGPNGAGKTTLLQAIANEISITGKILYKEKSINDWNAKTLAQHKAKFSQHHTQDIPLSVQEVVMMGRYPYFENTPHRIDLKVITKAMQITDVFSLKKHPYNQLSGGEKQRVHLARVMAQLDNDISQKMLLLDEPLNNLDVYHQHQMLYKIKAFTQQGNIGIMVIHDLNLAAQFADYVLLLKQGALIAAGTPEEVLQPKIICNVYEFPCQRISHPFSKSPMIIFGEQQSISTEQKSIIYEHRN
ncbi:heme ABC transporter ATP-binding protein [Zhouia sp. PK063]|uniref:heme ABC transporter ATP-binding protein n=1 Tax=Zhouia sp. PK063 TaxID=3373602 RepID=UPI0037B90C89